MDWIDLAQDRDQWRAVVSTGIHLRVQQNVGKFFNSCTTGGFSRRAQLHGVALCVTVEARILVKPRIYAANIGFTKQRW
jgi:hypothetical protein